MVKTRYHDIFSRLGFAVVIMFALSLFATFNAGVVSAEHTPKVTISPDIANCGQLGNTFTVNVKNSESSNDSILQVEIYKALAGISDFECGDAPSGWTLFSFTDRCIYVTELNSADRIDPGEDLDFTFDAVMSSDSCTSDFVVVTIDDAEPQGDRVTSTVTVNIDCTDPVILKSVGEPKIEGNGFDWWITQDTDISVSVSDNKTSDECNLGLDYCEITYTVDGGDPQTEVSQSFDPETYSWNYEWNFDEDSVHVINITCYDVAGNHKTIIETDKVDSTPPETSKTYGEPHFPEDINNNAPYPHYITTRTPITLDAPDGGDICAVGTKKIYYFDTVVNNSFCQNEELCQPVCTPYNMQSLNMKLDVCDWQEYTGPFTKNEQSCHILQYYSVDELGNIEPMKWQCVFVDDTPPMGIKKVEEPNTKIEKRLTDGDEYERNPSLVKANGVWYLFYASDTNPNQNGYGCDENGLNCDADEYEIYMTTSSDEGQSWSEPVKVSQHIGNFNQRDVSAVWDGSALYAFVSSGSGSEPVYYYISNDNGLTWNGPTQVSPSNPVNVGHFDALYFNGKIWLFYGESDGLAIRNSDNWDTEYKATMPELTHSKVIKAFVDEGNVTVVWERSGQGIWYTTSSDPAGTNSWTTSRKIAQADVGPNAYGDYDPVMYRDSNGVYWLFWAPYNSQVGNPGSQWIEFKFAQSKEGLADAVSNRATLGGYEDIYWWDFWPEIIENSEGKLVLFYTSEQSDDKTDRIDGNIWMMTEPEVIWVQDHVTRVGLDCVDQYPHPVMNEKVCYKVLFDDPQNADLTEQYCEEMQQTPGNNGQMEDGWCCANVSGGLAYWITFTEDSKHTLQYYCEDALGNRNRVDTEFFRVDSQPPIISKTIEGPTWGHCPPEQGSEEKCYLKDWTGESEGSVIHIDAQDDDSYGCAVDQVTCRWWYVLDGEFTLHTENGKILKGKSGWMNVPFDIKFYDDTEHELHVECRDALGNSVEDVEKFYLDSKGPDVEKIIHGPFYKDESGREWIDTATTIELSATDQPENTPCAVGTSKIYYRYEIDPTNQACETPQDEAYCSPRHSPQEEGWTEYTEPFGIPETSCHIIEYYAVDNLGNIGPVGANCLYADHTKPVAYSNTGEPRIKCTTENSPGGEGSCEGEPGMFSCDAYNHEQCEAIPGCTYMLICSAYDEENAEYCSTFSQTGDYEGCQSAEECYVDTESSVCLGSPDSCEAVAENWPEDPQGKCEETPGCSWVTEPDCDWWVQDHTTEITIKCRNGNNEPHPSPLDKIYWRVKVDDNPWGEWHSADYSENGVSLTFNEDSVHTIEYYCTDKVEKESNHQTKVYRVDSTPPEITTGIEGPHYYNETEGKMYINHVTNITVNAADPDPTGYGCAIDDVKCSWYYYLDNAETPLQGGEDLKPPFKIHFPEETKHELHIVCSDALGNTAEKVETYYADWTPPTTIKTYGQPEFSEECTEYPKWITSDTPITLTVEDSGPHKSGIKETKYRVTQVDDKYCWNQSLCVEEAQGSGNWVTVTEQTNPFKISEQSCHLIEYYSVDNVDKTEDVKKQCVFVDNTPPETAKTVGQPNSKIYPENYTWKYYPEANGRCWTGEDPIDCWKVTTLTPIILDCKDQEPHPVNHDKLCFHVDFDAMDYTEQHCNAENGGEITTDENGKNWCCYDWDEYHTRDQDGVWLYFSEESEHELEYYCEDALGNKGQTDIEKFKVEGTAFEIPIFKKWNLISVPFQLLDSNPEVVFSNVSGDIETVWTYDGETGKWYAYSPDGVDNDDLEAIEPGWGYWVFARNNTHLKIGGSLFKPGPYLPVERYLPAGWNLIGYYGTDWQDYDKAVDPCAYGRGLPYYNTVYNSLYSLMDEVTVMDPETGLPVEWAKPNWRSLYAYQTCGIEDPNNQPYWLPLDYEDMMYPGYGYWIHMESDDVYTPSFKILGEDWWHPMVI